MPAKKPATTTCSPAQRKHLLERLARARYSKANSAPDLKEPESVRKARLIVKRWESALGRISCGHRDRRDRRYDQVKSAILFDSPEAALAAVKAFEAGK
jgi:hypothetical protein